mmetsp:Transcript_24687/g.67267  ORF Transcript_24687/g.67267 Transcript_24687/m.67267 type:complete len:99 (-) Transcript_24687:3679-3975(-)|eukprot:CAMPEP_0202399960 /NCGR_PEP_ID=MMETSP1128-20130828/2373_1 /ASSEMBLY_ACC=CAM_ASM_000463 /TAXON_ID=3047 /ORGANISM="Dunaliella tertiolecta, Strain CCMP1320" /LENGTH=98 /DNA_ID=CAMNT_0049003391 /DNA_START=478 /DNA_END=774 /DNA_ORIENTATION=+
MSQSLGSSMQLHDKSYKLLGRRGSMRRPGQRVGPRFCQGLQDNSEEEQLLWPSHQASCRLKLLLQTIIGSRNHEKHDICPDPNKGDKHLDHLTHPTPD